MTRRLTISLPDDLAAELDRLPSGQVSGFVAEALRRRRISDDARAALDAAGHRDFPFDPDGARQRLAAGRIDAQTRDAAVARAAVLTGMDRDAMAEQLGRSAATSGW
ncbi:MAG TPA: hypothetical protein VF657_19345 [Actinoplanes sp.]|jgi:hypothetical protein